jgi:hypothetical protein
MVYLKIKYIYTVQKWGMRKSCVKYAMCATAKCMFCIFCLNIGLFGHYRLYQTVSYTVYGHLDGFKTV